MARHIRLALVSALVLSAVGCGNSSSPTAPSPTTPSPAAFSLNGRVIDDATLREISGATVLIVDGPHGGTSSTTDTAGAFSFTGLQQSGFTVSVSAPNYASQTRGVTLTSNQTLTFQLTRSTPPPNFQGQYTGTYVTTGCTETAPGGLCAGLGFGVSRTLSLALSLQQSQTTVIGNLRLGVTGNIATSLGSSTIFGPFQGTIQPSNHLTGIAAVNSQNTVFCVFAPVDPGLPGGGGYAICGLTGAASEWDTTIAANTLAGSFKLVFSGSPLSAPTGTAIVSATLVEVTRQ